MTSLAVSLDPNQVSPGLLGFIIVCILGVCVWLLCRNMGKHLNKLDADYQVQEAEALAVVEAVPVAAAAAKRAPAAKKAAAAKKSAGVPRQGGH